MAATCPACSASGEDVHFRTRRQDWVCDLCDHSWAGETPGSEGPEPPGEPALAAFISYGHKDAPKLVRRLKTGLETLGIMPVWLDAEMIDAGDDWQEQVHEGIAGSDALLAVMTAHSLRPGGICWREVAFADALGRRVVPLRVDADPALRVNFLLAGRSWADFTCGEWDEALERLRRGLLGDTAALRPAAPIGGLAPLDFSYEVARYDEHFTGRAWLEAELDAWLAHGKGRVFVIVGEPGLGKSAIAAHLTQREDVAAAHFCSSGDSRTLDPQEFVASVASLLAQRLPPFAEALGTRHPEQPRTDARTGFRELIVEPALNIDPPSTPQLVIIDALDEAALRDGETIIDLIVAHAEALPPWLRLVMTSRPEDAATSSLQAIGLFEIDAARPENVEDVGAYIAARLDEVVRLSPPERERLAAVLCEKSAGNFLYAKLAADAVAEGHLSPEEADSLPRGLDTFYMRAFKTLFPSPSMYLEEVAPVLGTLAAGFAPLPLPLLARACSVKPEALNQRLVRLRSFLRINRASDERSWALFHRTLGEWLCTQDSAGNYWCDLEAGHARLVEALAGDPLGSDYSVRWLPRHLLALGRVEEIADLLVQPPFLTAALGRDQVEVRRLWARLSERGLSPAEAYGPLIGSEAAGEDVLTGVGELLYETGDYDLALRAFAGCADAAQERDDPATLAAVLGKRAHVLASSGRLSEALELFEEEADLCRRIGDQDGLQRALGDRALLTRTLGELQTAMELLREQERICRGHSLPYGLQRCLGRQALVLRDRGDLDGALALLDEKETICGGLGYTPGRQTVLVDRAAILAHRGDLDGARRLLDEACRLCRMLRDDDGLQRVLGDMALILLDKGDSKEALDLCGRQLELCRELGNPAHLQIALGNMAQVLRESGDRDGASQALATQEEICTRLSDQKGLQRCLYEQALIARSRGDLDNALRLLSEQEDICRRLPLPAGLHRSLGQQAAVCRDRGQLDKALALLREKELLCRGLGDSFGLHRAMADRAMLLNELGQPAAALELLGEAETMGREAGDDQLLHDLLADHAEILVAMDGDLERAVALLRESELACRKLGDDVGLQRVLGEQALICKDRGDLEAAAILRAEQESLCRRLGDLVGLQRALGRRAEIMMMQGDHDDAEPLLEEKEMICRELGLKPDLERATEALQIVRAAGRREPRGA